MADMRLARSEHAELWALAPSSAEVQKGLQELAQLVPVEGSPRRRVSFDENSASIVLRLASDFGSVLLGGDKIEAAAPSMGWRAIASRVRPDEKSVAFKVAHHGAPNGDAPCIWSDLLLPSPISCVTPYRPSGRPRTPDLERLTERSADTYLTAPPKGRKPRRTKRMVDREMATATRSRRTLIGDGHIRIRLAADRSPEVALAGDARRVSLR